MNGGLNQQLLSQSEALAPRFARCRRVALVAALAGLALTALGYLTQPEQFFRSWLLGFVYWVSLTLGCLMVLLIHHLAGGRWGFAVRRILEAGARTWPLMLILGLPVLAGLHDLYHWTHTEVVAEDKILQHKSPFLNTPFFVVRYLLYFALWGGMVQLLHRWSKLQDEQAETWPTRRMQVLSGPGLVLFVLSGTLAGVDWIMSLEPHWFSTIFSAIYIIGQGLAAWAFVAVVGVSLSRHEPLRALLSNERLRDLGTFMLGFVLLWAYTSFSQLLIIWAGNLPEEITWYYTRLSGGWLHLGYLLIGFHFAVPFLLMISSRLKSRLRILVSVACGLLVMRLLDLYWISAPAFQGGQASAAPHWLDLIIPFSIGCLWLFVFFGHLKSRCLVPLNDPRFDFTALAAETAEEDHHG